MKVLVALGTRPEVIKLAPVIAALWQRLEVKVCASGQHREMLQQALDAFGLCPDHMLDTMSPGRSLNILAARLLEGMDAELAELKKQNQQQKQLIQLLVATVIGLAIFGAWLLKG